MVVCEYRAGPDLTVISNINSAAVSGSRVGIKCTSAVDDGVALSSAVDRAA